MGILYNIYIYIFNWIQRLPFRTLEIAMFMRTIEEYDVEELIIHGHNIAIITQDSFR